MYCPPIFPTVYAKQKTTMTNGTNYLILLNYCVGEIVKIKLTEEEKKISKTYDDFEHFIKEHIEEKYQVRLKDCEWMTLETFNERSYNMKGGKYA